MDAIDSIRLWSVVTIACSAFVLIVLERFFPYQPQRFARKGIGTDLIMYALVQSYVMGLLISYLISMIDDHTTLDRWHAVRDLPLTVQFAVFFITHDFYIYWFHRWQHSNPVLWRLHEAHHSTVDVDWLSGSRSHSLEILVNQTIEFAPILLLASPEIAVVKGAVDAVWGMYIHSNIDVRTGWLQYIINGPEMHRWHHARDGAAHNKNFSTKLAIWDWMFGTAFRPTDSKPGAYGIGIEYPQNYFKQHVYAFRRSDRNQ